MKTEFGDINFTTSEMLRESYILIYKLVVVGLIAVEYIRVGRTGVNAYVIRIKL